MLQLIRSLLDPENMGLGINVWICVIFSFVLFKGRLELLSCKADSFFDVMRNSESFFTLGYCFIPWFCTMTKIIFFLENGKIRVLGFLLPSLCSCTGCTNICMYFNWKAVWERYSQHLSCRELLSLIWVLLFSADLSSVKETLHTLQHSPIHWSFICLDDYKRATTLDHIVDLLTFCVLHHNYNMRSYLLGKDLIKRVLVLLQSRHKFLALGRQVWILRYTLT